MSSNSSFWAHWLVRAVLLAFAFIFGLSVGYSRIVLGAHAWNQLLLGWQLGIWLALTMHYIFRDSILENVRKLLESRNSNFSHTIVIYLLIMIATLTAMIVNVKSAEPRIVDDPAWYQAISSKCGEDKAQEAFEAKGIIDVGLVGIGFGAYFGIMF